MSASARPPNALGAPSFPPLERVGYRAKLDTPPPPRTANSFTPANKSASEAFAQNQVDGLPILKDDHPITVPQHHHLLPF